VGYKLTAEHRSLDAIRSRQHKGRDFMPRGTTYAARLEVDANLTVITRCYTGLANLAQTFLHVIHDLAYPFVGDIWAIYTDYALRSPLTELS
jgi:hypothetical protein